MYLKNDICIILLCTTFIFIQSLILVGPMHVNCTTLLYITFTQLLTLMGAQGEYFEDSLVGLG
jgi:hypothetical protein